MANFFQTFNAIYSKTIGNKIPQPIANLTLLQNKHTTSNLVNLPEDSKT